MGKLRPKTDKQIALQDIDWIQLVPDGILCLNTDSLRAGNFLVTAVTIVLKQDCDLELFYHLVRASHSFITPSSAAIFRVRL
jgi:hypothetical protein